MWRSHLMGWVTGAVWQVVELPGKKSKIEECRKTRGWRKKQLAFENLTWPNFPGHCPDASHRISQACSQGHCFSEQHWTWGCHPKGPGVAADWDHHTDTWSPGHCNPPQICWCNVLVWAWLQLLDGMLLCNSNCFFFFNITASDFNFIPLVPHDCTFPKPVQLLYLWLA